MFSQSLAFPTTVVPGDSVLLAMLPLPSSKCAVIECLPRAVINGKTTTQPDKTVTGVRWHYSPETFICLSVMSSVCLFNSGIISTFLHVHPFGANIEYLWSYMQQLDSKVNPFSQLALLKCSMLIAGCRSKCVSWVRDIIVYGGLSVLLHKN